MLPSHCCWPLKVTVQVHLSLLQRPSHLVLAYMLKVVGNFVKLKKLL